jgi:hypothetical protein
MGAHFDFIARLSEAKAGIAIVTTRASAAARKSFTDARLNPPGFF